MIDMLSKTYLQGKDAALEDTIAKTDKLLKKRGFEVKAESLLNPVPNCWSAHIVSCDLPWISSNGKGTSREACLASGKVEFLERLATNFFFSDYYLGRDSESAEFVFFPDEKWFPVEELDRIPMLHPDGSELLNRQLRSFYNPENELTPDLLHDINSENSKRGICALPFQAISTGETVYFPVNILHNLYASNGMSAGNTPDESRAQALSEIVERYVKQIVISRGLCLPDVPREQSARCPAADSAIKALESRGFHVLVKDASLGGRFPVICVLLINPDNRGCYASFGANCRFEVALERTVVELLQGRNLDQLGEFPAPSHEIGPVSDSLNLESHFINSEGLLAWSMFRDNPEYTFSPWEFSGTTGEECRRLEKLIAEEGFTIYRAEYPYLGMYACRIIVPGMSEIYPVSDLLWNNSIAGASLRTHLLTLEQMSLKELREFYSIIEDLQFNEDQLISHAIGVVFEQESAWHSLRIGELKALITLAAGHPEEAYTWCGWCAGFGHLPPDRNRLMELIYNLISLALKGERISDYRKSLAAFYGEPILARAEMVLNQKDNFPDLNFAPSWEEISPPHQELLNFYARLNICKSG